MNQRRPLLTLALLGPPMHRKWLSLALLGPPVLRGRPLFVYVDECISNLLYHAMPVCKCFPPHLQHFIMPIQHTLLVQVLECGETKRTPVVAVRRQVPVDCFDQRGLVLIALDGCAWALCQKVRLGFCQRGISRLCPLSRKAWGLCERPRQH